MFAINCEKKFSAKIPPSRYDLESKVKTIIDLSKQLESRYRQVKALKELYDSDFIDLRRQISEEISIIFRYAPIDHGRTCEEILWKCNYYDCVKFFKARNIRKANRDDNLFLFRAHLISGIGHYHSLVTSLQKVFNLPYLEELIFLPILNDRLSNPVLRRYFDPSGNRTPKSTDYSGYEQQISKRFDLNEDIDEDAYDDLGPDYVYDEKSKEILLFLAHRFFICIGDLARYYVDFFGNGSDRFKELHFEIATFYYKSASLIQSQIGMPYNQLGTLYANSFYCLDSLYYYFRCLNSKKSFDGTKKNLTRTFEHIQILTNAHKKSAMHGKHKKSNKTESLAETNGFLNIGENDFQNDHDLIKSTICRVINIFSQIFKLNEEIENSKQQIPVAKLLAELNPFLVLFRNALNIESAGEIFSLKPNRLPVEQIFQILSIIIVLIDQIKKSMKKHSIRIDMTDMSDILNRKNVLIGDIRVRSNFLLYLSYHFLFQMMTMIIHREREILKKIMYTTQNLMDEIPETPIIKPSKKKNKLGVLEDSNRKQNQYSRSFSSDVGDQLDETMSQLKITAFQTIQDVLDSSENEEDDEVDEMREFQLNLISNPSSPTEMFNNGDDGPDYSLVSDPKTFDQVLTFAYVESYTPLVKFFCDFMQSNSDFIEILQNLSALLEYFEQFFQYLNIVSEWDLKLLVNFKFYLEKQIQTSNAKPQSDKLHNLMDLFNFINQCAMVPVKNFKQKSPLSSEMNGLNLTEEMSNFYQQLFECPDEISMLNLPNQLSAEKSGYLCIRCLLIFGVKLALLSLDNGSFKLSVQDYDLSSIHDMKESKHVSFVFKLIEPIELSILHSDRYALPKKIKAAEEQLISFSDKDSNDKEVESVCSNDNDANHSVSYSHNNMSDEKNTPTPTQGTSKSLYDLERLPNILIDPYVYLESLDLIKQMVQQKKAFLIVPKLVTDFLNNLKDTLPAAAEASDFLHEEFFRGSRMIRFIRNDDRLELDMLQYPRNCVWRRKIDDEADWTQMERTLNSYSDVKMQDVALLYELLEHCRYLLTKKMLINSKIPTIGNVKDEEFNVKITLITNNLSKWPSNVLTTVLQSNEIEIETLDSYLAKQNTKNKKNNPNSRYKRFHRLHNSRSPQVQKSSAHFRPIQFNS